MARRFLFALCLLAMPAFADDAPWVAATALVKDVNTDIVKGGIHGIDSHVPDLEKALADGMAGYPPEPGANGQAVVLTDGPAETLLALAAAAKQKQATTAISNPYADVGLMLALYYNEMRRPQEALRVIDTTFRLKPVQGAFVGAHDAGLLTEQATAYEALKRWSDGLASADTALKASQTDRDKSRSHRARGFNLVELGRLNEAEIAYGNSLKLEPNNAVARSELAYIARLRAGGPSAPPQQITPKPAEPGPPKPPPV